MTRFSVVVPVYDVQAYLPECLDSVLGQSFADFELIAVDDASPDGSAAILDERALVDARVRVIHLPHNVGLGPARQAGMELATGDYLLFLDSDDTLAEGALQRIESRLSRTGDPDVLVFDFARTYSDGAAVANPRSGLLTAAGPDVFTIEDRPDLVSLLMVVWNKAYCRSFVEANGFRFFAGFYEDAPWTYSTLLAAERIAILDEVCVCYRQGRQGNILGSRSRQHFDIFDQYDRVFDFLDARELLAGWRPVMFNRMLDHFFTVLTDPVRLHARDRAEFFHIAHRRYHRHRPPGYHLPAGRTGVKYGLFGLGSFPMFTAFRRAQAALDRADVTRAREHGSRLARRSARAGMLLYYHAQLRLPVDERLAVYAAYWFAAYGCNPKAIDDKARELAPHVRSVWVLSDGAEQALPEGVECVRPGTRAYYQALARAKYLVNNVNFPHEIVKRTGSVHVQTQHGTPLKKMGLDLQDHPVAAAGMNFERLRQHCRRWDFLVSANPFSSEVWKRSYPGRYRVLETGYPRNDRLHAPTADEFATAREELGLRREQTVVLYCPTFRDWRPEATPVPDFSRIRRALDDGCTVLLRSHYYDPTGLGLGDAAAQVPRNGRVVDVSAHPSIETLCLAADVLLTDYSSVMFDYANLDRPIVIYAPDWDAYVRWRGVNFDLLGSPPGVVATTEDDLVEAFRSGAPWAEEATRARALFRERFCRWDDGRAAERVVRSVFLGEQSDVV